MRTTGSNRADAEDDYLRMRRHRTLSRLAAWMRHDSHDLMETLSFDEAVEALGRRGEQSLGLQVIPLERIVGSVDKVRDFDRRFRPTTDRGRERWERMARLSREGEAFPPIDVYQLGELYFVRDGHHRVSVARALDATSIEAYVTRIDTVIAPDGVAGRSDLDDKNWGLRFLRRVPLSAQQRPQVTCVDPSSYHRLAEMVEAWAARQMHRDGAYMDKETMARRWFEDEYLPALALIDEAGVRGADETGADAYIRVAGERYRLIREHDWNADVLRRVAEAGGEVRR